MTDKEINEMVLSGKLVCLGVYNKLGDEEVLIREENYRGTHSSGWVKGDMFKRDDRWVIEPRWWLGDTVNLKGVD